MTKDNPIKNRDRRRNRDKVHTERGGKETANMEFEATRAIKLWQVDGHEDDKKLYFVAEIHLTEPLTSKEFIKILKKNLEGIV